MLKSVTNFSMDPLQIANMENWCIDDYFALALHFVMQNILWIYIPTDNNTDYSTSMCDAISSIARKFPNSPLWITRDINLPDIQWKTNTVSKHQYTKQINEHFLDTFSMLGLSACEPIPGISDHDASSRLHKLFFPKRHRPIQSLIHVWRKTDSRLIQEDLTTFADELQNDHNIDTPVETMWASVVSRCKYILA